MPGVSIAKDLHRLMRRIGPLTDGQASIDDVNWENGDLASFGVTIRPNASFYKGGRFKFTVHVPYSFEDSDPYIWCETEIPHPNIDTSRFRSYEPGSTNICLNFFDSGVWNPTHGLEGIVLGILFLMHNPNLDDALVGGFPSGDPEGVARFAEDVKTYMATGACNEKTYDIDFRVIDGEFKDLREENGTNRDNESETNREKTNINFPDLVVNGIEDDFEAEEEGDIMPVRFARVDTDPNFVDPDEYEEDIEGCFYITFGPFDPNNADSGSVNDVIDTNETKDDIVKEDAASNSELVECVEYGISNCTSPMRSNNVDDSEQTQINGSEKHDQNNKTELAVVENNDLNALTKPDMDNDWSENKDKQVSVSNVKVTENDVAELNNNLNDSAETGYSEEAHKTLINETPNFGDIGAGNGMDIESKTYPQEGKLSKTEQCMIFGIVVNLVLFAFRKFRNR